MYKVINYTKDVKALLNSNKKSFVFESIINGHTYGQIYVNSLDNPELYVVMDGGNFVLYIGGETADANLYKECIKFIEEHILTDELRERFDDHILISYSSDTIKNEVKNVFKESIVHESVKSLYRYDITQNTQRTLEYDFCDIKTIDQEILDSNLENLSELKNEINGMWGNTKSFIKHGFGYCAVRENKLLSWCTAEFISNKSCGIGIETVEDEQGKGIATMVASKFVDKCTEIDLMPYWDSWLKNYPSVKIAQKVGFDLIEDYEVIVVKF
ncbi:MAG: GNAT family N-acetyltransferase [Clostridiales bacterium]|nr:GNAT family N-acetyltransferase [Clostridiales bacterium]